MDISCSETTELGLEGDYEAAIASVRQAIEQFRGCSPEERASLQRDLDQLHAMAEKLAAGKVEIVVFGEISTGKSALINALVGEAVTEVNVRGGWTKDVWHLDWNGSGYCVPGLANSQLVLIDTPGLN
jgi:ribosome biogenesis GTPase A